MKNQRPALSAACTLLAFLLLLPPLASARATANAEHEPWTAQAARVEIVRDDYGIAHVHGKTDADAVFGMVYAQAEDDFPRIEQNYLVNLGLLAEADGEKAIWQDLRQRLFLDHDKLKADYAASPAWLRQLMDAWAAGLNYYLATHPQVQPRRLTRFEPWMALSFSEGSIGGDIERIPLTQLQALHEQQPIAMTALECNPALRPPSGSNGAAIAPSHTKDGHALLLINPHTSFYFRSELQIHSDEGLDAYGAVTWGQFFVYQGFNARVGWMHTSSGVDNVDEFAETIVRGVDGTLRYRYGDELRPLATREVTLRYRKGDGSFGERRFTTHATHHGPIIRQLDDGRWIAFAMMNRPVAALEQSFLRTKATDFASFIEVAARQANSSNNTLYADADGVIAYLHPQFVPVRNPKFDYRKPVDGSDPSADWQGLHTLAQLPQAVSPANGWAYNSNDWPWATAGANSPKAADFPPYMDQAGPNARGPHAEMVLNARSDFTEQSLIGSFYDSYLTGFATLLPRLQAAYAHLPKNDPQRKRLAAPIALLDAWDKRWSAESTATTLAVHWGEVLWPQAVAAGRNEGLTGWQHLTTKTGDAEMLTALDEVVKQLQADFGNWRQPWGKLNRYQRNDGAIVQTFDDSKPSLPVPFTSGRWGSLASYEARRYPGTKLRYGTSGNSFVAVAEFGPRLRAWAVSIGGESSDPASKHFTDQARRYIDGNLRPVYFHADELQDHVERRYRPGQMAAE
ncbi:MAG: penicillin acylase family protein [Pseudoxanthomonas sp.]